VAKRLRVNRPFKARDKRIRDVGKLRRADRLLIGIDELTSTGAHVRALFSEEGNFFYQGTLRQPIIVVEKLNVSSSCFFKAPVSSDLPALVLLMERANTVIVDVL
jgi:hypothetical protein